MIIKYFEYLCCKIFTRLLLIKTIVLVFPGWTNFQIIIIWWGLDAIASLSPTSCRLSSCLLQLHVAITHLPHWAIGRYIYRPILSRISPCHLELFKLTLRTSESLWNRFSDRTFGSVTSLQGVQEKIVFFPFASTGLLLAVQRMAT